MPICRLPRPIARLSVADKRQTLCGIGNVAHNGDAHRRASAAYVVYAVRVALDERVHIVIGGDEVVCRFELDAALALVGRIRRAVRPPAHGNGLAATRIALVVPAFSQSAFEIFHKLLRNAPLFRSVIVHVYYVPRARLI